MKPAACPAEWCQRGRPIRIGGGKVLVDITHSDSGQNYMVDGALWDEFTAGSRQAAMKIAQMHADRCAVARNVPRSLFD